MILEQIEKDTGTIESEREVYTCGRKPFRRALRQTLRKRHFPTKLFHTESGTVEIALMAANVAS